MYTYIYMCSHSMYSLSIYKYISGEYILANCFAVHTCGTGIDWAALMFFDDHRLYEGGDAGAMATQPKKGR